MVNFRESKLGMRGRNDELLRLNAVVSVPVNGPDMPVSVENDST
jgi:hypothetical protein